MEANERACARVTLAGLLSAHRLDDSLRPVRLPSTAHEITQEAILGGLRATLRCTGDKFAPALARLSDGVPKGATPVLVLGWNSDKSSCLRHDPLPVEVFGRRRRGAAQLRQIAVDAHAAAGREGAVLMNGVAPHATRRCDASDRTFEGLDRELLVRRHTPSVGGRERVQRQVRPRLQVVGAAGRDAGHDGDSRPKSRRGGEADHFNQLIAGQLDS